MRTIDDLRQFQAVPLEIKIAMTKRRIVDWVCEFGTDGVYVSFSGGKDSTVLLHMVRQMYPSVEAVFVNTGLEYPEIQKFVKTFENVTILRPKMRFDEVIKKYGYPVIGKHQSETIDYARRNLAEGKYSLRLRRLGLTADRAEEMGLKLPPAEMLQRYGKASNGSKFEVPKYEPLLWTDFNVSAACCNVMKKNPVKQYERETGKVPILATMAEESMQREVAWLKNGCNAFDAKRPTSQPMSFWTEQDVLQYIKKYNVPSAPVYGEVEYKTNPAQRRLEEYGVENCGSEPLCTTGCKRTGCVFCAFGAQFDPEPRFERLKQTHPRQYDYCINGGKYNENGEWQPNKQGLGMGHVFDELNKIYGEGFIKY